MLLAYSPCCNIWPAALGHRLYAWLQELKASSLFTLSIQISKSTSDRENLSSTSLSQERDDTETSQPASELITLTTDETREANQQALTNPIVESRTGEQEPSRLLHNLYYRQAPDGASQLAQTRKELLPDDRWVPIQPWGQSPLSGVPPGSTSTTQKVATHTVTNTATAPTTMEVDGHSRPPPSAKNNNARAVNGAASQATPRLSSIVVVPSRPRGRTVVVEEFQRDQVRQRE